MIVNFWVIAQLIGMSIVVLISLYALYQGILILRGWDFSRRDERQFKLERKTYLVSTLMQYALAFQLLSLIVFIATAEYLHSFIKGAMCAFGSLNANAYGFRSFWMKIGAVFIYSSWILINHIDSSREDYPLVRIKYALLLPVVAAVLADAYLELKYFSGINPQVITSCCSSVFRTTSNPYGFVAKSIPLVPGLAAFFVLHIAAEVSGYFTWKSGKLPVLSGIFMIIAFCISLLGMFSFLSPYFNVVLLGLPTMHFCPFEVLKVPYIGYPLYALLLIYGIGGFWLLVLKLLSRKLEVASYVKGVAKVSLISLSGFFVVVLAFIAAYTLEVGSFVYH